MLKSDAAIKSETLPKVIKTAKNQSDTQLTVSNEPSDLPFLDDVSESDARDMVYRGSLSMQYMLFKHARDIRPKVTKLNSLISKIEDELFSEDMLQELEKSQLLKLYSLATSQVTESIGFLERLHTIIQDANEVVKVTSSMSYKDTNITSLESVNYRVGNNDKLRNIKDILIKNILGDEKPEVKVIEES
jgi:hypothetical protein